MFLALVKLNNGTGNFGKISFKKMYAFSESGKQFSIFAKLEQICF